jgi:hypothetical protein
MQYAPLSIVLAAQIFFLDFRTTIVESYSYLFGDGNEEDEQDTTSDFSGATQFAKQWGWYTSIYELAQGDVRRFDEVTRLSIHQCLTWLTYKKQRLEIFKE